ncbi:MAG: hypothetical protein MI924_09395, partial [Chloroflexales bacterium]|nr:hypothetical protein [Chloroflexales bacterium]
MRRTGLVWLILSMAVLLSMMSCGAPDNRVRDSASSEASHSYPPAGPTPEIMPDVGYPPSGETRPVMPGVAYPHPLTELLSEIRPGDSYPPPGETRPFPPSDVYLSPTPSRTPQIGY